MNLTSEAPTAILNPHIYTSAGKGSQYNRPAAVSYLTASAHLNGDKAGHHVLSLYKLSLAFLMPLWLKIILMLIFVAENIPLDPIVLYSRPPARI